MAASGRCWAGRVWGRVYHHKKTSGLWLIFDITRRLSRSMAMGQSITLRRKNLVCWPMPTTALGTPEMTFFRCRGEEFEVRTVGYLKTWIKAPSEDAIYDNVGVNFLRPTNKTVRFVVDNPKIPKLMSGKDGLDRTFPPNPKWSAEFGVPEIVVLNIMFPWGGGNLFSAHPPDDHGWNLVQ